MSPPVRRDDGSVIVLVLVLMIIGSLMVLPLLDYAGVVLKANTVLSDKTERTEAAKGGLRAALADTESIYDTCDDGGPNTPVPLGDVEINGLTVTSRCFFLDHAGLLEDDERRVGVTVVQSGEVAPEPLFVQDTTDPAAIPRWSPPASSPTTDWLATAAPNSQTGQIFLPNLPGRGVSQRSSIGSAMNVTLPGFDPLNPHALADQCVVYFPGTYKDPMTIQGPAKTFFANGNYYFENEVRIIGGADVVVGDGAAACTTTQEALFGATPEPTGGHNVTGAGATWVLGAGGRVVVDNTVNDAPINVHFNRRYVSSTDYVNQPTADVSIMTANGDETAPDPDGSGPLLPTYGDLDVPDVIHVPQSYVGATPDDPNTPANENDPALRYTAKVATGSGYVPSLFTPEVRVPERPGTPTVQAFAGGAIVTWTAPLSDGGASITSYTVTGSGGQACETHGTLSCAVTGLSPGSHTFTVVATNSKGTSLGAVSAAVSISSSGTALAAPPAVGAPTLVMSRDPDRLAAGPAYDPLEAAVAQVTFTAPTLSANTAPITQYLVEYATTWDPDVNPGGAADALTDNASQPNTLGIQVSGANVTSPTWTTACTIDAGVRYLQADGSSWQAPLRCDVADLDVRATYEFRVRAVNEVGQGPTSPSAKWDHVAPVDVLDGAVYFHDGSRLASGDPTTPPDITETDVAAFIVDPSDDGTDADADGIPETPTKFWIHPYVAVTPPAAVGSLPRPVLEFKLTSTTAGPVTVNVPGYVSIPMSRLVLDNPTGQAVTVTGGVLAARIDLNDARNTGPNTVPVGFSDEQVQRKFRIESTVPGGARSTAVVQINQNGAHAINSWEVQ